MKKILQIVLVVAVVIVILAGISGDDSGYEPPVNTSKGKVNETEVSFNFPAGYIDSPYVLQNGSAIYFLQSPALPFEFLTGDKDLQPVRILEGHQGGDSNVWWNTDLYVSRKNPDGTWGRPTNLGPEINSTNLECCVWVNEKETKIIFTRESIGDKSETGTFLSTRNSKNDPWGEVSPLPGDVGAYLNDKGLHDIHPTPSGDLYMWTEQNGRVLYYAESIGENTWKPAVKLPSNLLSKNKESQPWLNNDETVMFYGRGFENADHQLMRTQRDSRDDEWEDPVSVPLENFADKNGALVWGEPSFTSDGTLYYVQFDTSQKGWPAYLFSSPKQGNGFGIPSKLIFSF